LNYPSVLHRTYIVATLMFSPISFFLLAACAILTHEAAADVKDSEYCLGARVRVENDWGECSTMFPSVRVNYKGHFQWCQMCWFGFNSRFLNYVCSSHIEEVIEPDCEPKEREEPGHVFLRFR